MVVRGRQRAPVDRCPIGSRELERALSQLRGDLGGASAPRDRRRAFELRRDTLVRAGGREREVPRALLDVVLGCGELGVELATRFDRRGRIDRRRIKRVRETDAVSRSRADDPGRLGRLSPAGSKSSVVGCDTAAARKSDAPTS